MPTSCVMRKTDPPIENDPSSGSSSPARMRRIVLLPTPLTPTSATCSPGATVNDRSKNSESAPGGAYSSSATATCDMTNPARYRSMPSSADSGDPGTVPRPRRRSRRRHRACRDRRRAVAHRVEQPAAGTACRRGRASGRAARSTARSRSRPMPLRAVVVADDPHANRRALPRTPQSVDEAGLPRLFDIFSPSLLISAVCIQCCTNGSPVAASDCARSHSW